MPYIKQNDRLRIQSNACEEGLEVWLNNAGELNFTVTYLIDRYLDRKGTNYANINEMIGALECAKQELYRRVAARYEDKKIKENGEVYHEYH